MRMDQKDAREGGWEGGRMITWLFFVRGSPSPLFLQLALSPRLPPSHPLSFLPPYSLPTSQELCKRTYGISPENFSPSPDPVKLLYMLTYSSLSEIKYGASGGGSGRMRGSLRFLF